jgi:hypothetical protein
MSGGTHFEELQPFVDLFTERSHVNAPKALRIALQPQSCPVQQRASASGIAMLQVMKRSRDLNQCLQESFLRFFRSQPHTLPMFMSSKEFLRTIASQTFAKFSFVPSQFHAEALPPEGSKSGESRLNLTSTLAGTSLDGFGDTTSANSTANLLNVSRSGYAVLGFLMKETPALADRTQTNLRGPGPSHQPWNTS